MPYCAVPGCLNGTARQAKSDNSVKFFCFPRDPAKAELWWQKIRREGRLSDVKDPRVCSHHFKEDDYLKDLKFELLNPGTPLPLSKLKLSDSASPSEHIPASHATGEPSTRDASVRRSKKKELCDALEGMEEEAPKEKSCEGCKELQTEVDRLKQQIGELQQQLLQQRAPEKRASDAVDSVQPLSSGMFSKQQARALLTGQTPRHWDPESVRNSLKLRVTTSRKVYNWLRTEGLPLPSLTTLQRRLTGLQLEPNSTSTSQKLLEKLLADLPLRDRYCNVMVDEMNVTNVACFNQRGEQVLGPHDHLQLVLACGLFNPWKFPILFAFDQPATKAFMARAILAVESAGGRVVSLVSDQGGPNMGLWRELGIDFDAEVSFANPADPKRRIWVMADPPHALKNLRNHILDKGVKTGSGKVLDRGLMRKLLEVDGNSELRLLHKIHSVSHVEVAGQARQHVRPAVQLLSATCALAMERYLGRAEEARILRVVDDGFDVLNAGHPQDVKPFRRGYSGSPEQEAALTALQREILALRVGNASPDSRPIPFQRGLLVDIRSVRGLLSDLKQTFGPDVFLLTRRLCQDRLEATFGLLRVGGGSNTNPTPTDATSRLSLLALLMLSRRGINVLDQGAEVAPDPEASETSSDEEDERDLFDEDEDPDVFREPVPAPRADLETGVSAEASATAYLAGYVARHSDLGQPSYRAEEESLETLWTRLRSEGGLTVPTQEFLQEFLRMEKAFQAYHAGHKDNLSRQRGVIRRMVKIIQRRHSKLPIKVIRRFVRVRTFIRLRQTNRKRREAAQQKREARKRKSFAK